MRYTAATVDPDDFTPEAGYTLRQKEYGRDTGVDHPACGNNADEGWLIVLCLSPLIFERL